MDDDPIAVEVRPEDRSGVGAPLLPPRPLPKWPFVLAGLLLLIGVGIVAAWRVDVAYYTLSPGPVYDTSDFIEVPDAIVETSGEMFFLTVSLKEANVFEYLGAQIDPTVDLSPRENIRPPGVTQEELRRENLAAMEESKQDATFVALEQLGYDPVYIGTGAVVIETVPDSAADGVLMADDVILAVDRQPVGFRSDVIDILADKEIGDEVTLTLERPGEEGDDPETVDISLVLGPHVEDPDRPMIGVLLDNRDPIVEFPVDVTIDSQNIGGPSAGLMFTLQIIDQLTDEPLTHGHRIAGTGSINRDGTVGAIGGVQQKVYAAIDAGAVAVLVPEANYQAALAAARDDIEVVSVATIDDALAFLQGLAET